MRSPAGIAVHQTKGRGLVFSNQRPHGWPEIGGREFEVHGQASEPNSICQFALASNGRRDTHATDRAAPVNVSKRTHVAPARLSLRSDFSDLFHSRQTATPRLHYLELPSQTRLESSSAPSWTLQPCPDELLDQQRIPQQQPRSRRPPPRLQFHQPPRGPKNPQPQNQNQ